MEETTLAELNKDLRQTLVDIQKSERYDKRSMVYKNPEKWLNVAADIIAGIPSDKVRARHVITWPNYKAIQHEMAGTLDRYRELQANEAEINYSMSQELARMKMEKMHEAGDFDDKDARALDSVAKAGALFEGTARRLRGGADKVVEVRQAKSPQELAKELEEMFNQDVIDVTDSEDEA